MKKRRVISHLNLPARLPVWEIVIMYMWARLLPPVTATEQVFFYLVISWLVICSIGAIYNWLTEEQENIFTTIEKSESTPDRLNKMYAEIIRKHKEKMR